MQSISEHINGSGLQSHGKRSLQALYAEQLRFNNALLALLVSKSTITQNEANALAAQGIAK